MFGNLIRDNIPAKLEAEGKVCSYAVIQNDATHRELIREQLINTVNAFLRDNSVETLAEVQTVINAIAEEDLEAFTKEFDRQATEFGGYSEKYVFVRADHAVQPAAATTDAPETEQVAEVTEA